MLVKNVRAGGGCPSFGFEADVIGSRDSDLSPTFRFWNAMIARFIRSPKILHLTRITRPITQALSTPLQLNHTMADAHPEQVDIREL